jgi:hypothetical protein
MSSYRGRAGPNTSEYISNLNTVTSPYEQDQFNGDEVNFEEDLAMFTNADFTHFDTPQLPENDTFSFNLTTNEESSTDFKYEDLLAGPIPPADFTSTSPNDISPSNASFLATYNTANPTQINFATIPNPQSSTSQSSTTNTSISAQQKSSFQPQPFTEELSRLAAEEDKRRRNTAASARFRVKKKQREQALEQTVKKVSDKNAALTAKVSQLEMENKWLKNLVTEKHEGGRHEVEAAYLKFRRESEEREEGKVGGKSDVKVWLT